MNISGEPELLFYMFIPNNIPIFKMLRNFFSLQNNFSSSGSQGPQGPQGVTGATGPQGPPGDQGDQGQQGPQGVTGATGDQTIPGPPGPFGVTGVTGATGITGNSDNSILVVKYMSPGAYNYTIPPGYTTMNMTIVGVGSPGRLAGSSGSGGGAGGCIYDFPVPVSAGQQISLVITDNSAAVTFSRVTIGSNTFTAFGGKISAGGTVQFPPGYLPNTTAAPSGVNANYSLYNISGASGGAPGSNGGNSLFSGGNAVSLWGGGGGSPFAKGGDAGQDGSLGSGGGAGLPPGAGGGGFIILTLL